MAFLKRAENYGGNYGFGCAIYSLFHIISLTLAMLVNFGILLITR